MDTKEYREDPEKKDPTLVDRESASTLQTIKEGLNILRYKKESDLRTVKTLSKIADELQSAAPVISNVAVTNSENVHFGNNTYFNGPVVIKQIIQSNSGLENAAYTKTDNEDLENNAQSMKMSKCDESNSSGFHIKTWHKILIVLGSLVTVSLATTLALKGNDFDTLINSSTNASKVPGTNESLIIAKFHLRWVTRTEWLAEPPSGSMNLIRHPVPWVIIAHTATESCYTQSDCVLRTRLIQTFHIESRKWSDIGYNFLVGGDGSVYNGRGWDIEGAHTKGYNKFSIGIAFIGSFSTETPTSGQVEACRKLLNVGVELGKLDKDYKLLGHRQVWATTSPGDKLFDIIKTWPHFVKNTTGIAESLVP